MNKSLTSAALAAALVAPAAMQARSAAGQPFVVVCVGREAGMVEKNAANLLAQRLKETGQAQVRIETEGGARASEPDTIRILLGIPAHHAEIAQVFRQRRIPPLTHLAPGPEGFLLQSLLEKDRLSLLAAGVDDRGVVYAVGEILRQAILKRGAVAFPADLNLRTAPAFEVRGTQIGQSGVMREKAKARPWTEAERERAMADIILAGANTIGIGGDNVRKDDPALAFLASLGMKTLCHFGPNVGDGPSEWQAKESIGRLGYLCPSIPAARAALLKRCEDVFKNSPSFDYVRLVGGDGGGCECDLCKPYGGVFIRLCEEAAAIIHKYHPKTQIFVTNQKFDNASDQAIFAYLQEKPRTWMRAFCYGPGSDAMSWQPGHRQTHRMDLFRYPGYGPTSRYLHEILHQLPPQQDIVFYNEITHWRYSQFGYAQAYPRPDKNGDLPPHWGHDIYERMPDRYLTMVYDRLSFFAWPKFYHRMFGETVRYGIGDCTHSSGTHDHFNQWMWQRLLWNPQRGVEDVVDEYARAWFGPEAAAAMSKALFQLEQYLQDDPKTPLPEKKEVDTYYRLVQEAGKKMPAFRKGLQEGNLDSAITETLPWLDARLDTPQMQALRDEAMQLGEESNALFGVRSEGLYNLDHDFIGLGWTRRQLERARSAPADQKRELLAMIADYENPGEGGFYDDCGTYSKMPHLANGSPYDFGQPYVPEMLSEANRHSQRTLCFTQDEAKGVAFRYEGLDPKARYRVRVTLVRPKYQARYAGRMNQKSQSIYANDILLVRGLEVPERVSDFFTFDIPHEATKNGEVTIRFEKMPDVANGDRVSVEQWRNSGGWGTLVAEIWLLKNRD